jgi:hypothetical protein
MTDLAALQKSFAESVSGAPDPVLELVADDGRRRDRLEIHRNNTFASLGAVLQDAFPTVQAILGEAMFQRLATAFVRNRPPMRNHLLDYGAELAGFIAISQPLAAWPFLEDVARLDWAVNAAYGDPEAEPLDADRLSGLAPDALVALRLPLIPSARLVRSDWPVHAIRMNPEIADDPAALAPRAECVLVIRPDADVLALPVDAAEHAFLEALAGGATLGEAAAICQQADPAFDLQGALARHLAGGCFAARPDTEPEGEQE